jgi:hypothetical protein
MLTWRITPQIPRAGRHRFQAESYGTPQYTSLCLTTYHKTLIGNRSWHWDLLTKSISAFENQPVSHHPPLHKHQGLLVSQWVAWRVQPLSIRGYPFLLPSSSQPPQSNPGPLRSYHLARHEWMALCLNAAANGLQGELKDSGSAESAPHPPCNTTFCHPLKSVKKKPHCPCDSRGNLGRRGWGVLHALDRHRHMLRGALQEDHFQTSIWLILFSLVMLLRTCKVLFEELLFLVACFSLFI